MGCEGAQADLNAGGAGKKNAEDPRHGCVGTDGKGKSTCE